MNAVTNFAPWHPYDARSVAATTVKRKNTEERHFVAKPSFFAQSQSLDFSSKQSPQLRKVTKALNVVPVRIPEIAALSLETSTFILEASSNPLHHTQASILGNVAAGLLLFSAIADIMKSSLRLRTLHAQKAFIEHQLIYARTDSEAALRLWELNQNKWQQRQHYANLVVKTITVVATIAILFNPTISGALLALMALDSLNNITFIGIKARLARTLSQGSPDNQAFAAYKKTRFFKLIFDGGLDFALKVGCCIAIYAFKASGMETAINATAMIANLICLFAMATVLKHHGKKLFGWQSKKDKEQDQQIATPTSLDEQKTVNKPAMLKCSSTFWDNKEPQETQERSHKQVQQAEASLTSELKTEYGSPAKNL